MALDSETSLLLHMVGENNSTSFVDSSANPTKVIARYGNTKITTSEGKWPSCGSVHFDGVSNYLTSPQHTDFDLKSDNFTIEFWVYLNARSTGGERVFISKWENSISWIFGISNFSGTHYLFFYQGNNYPGIVYTFPLSTWTHLALVKSNGVITVYVNGSSIGTIASYAIPTANSALLIGKSGDASNYVNAYFQDLRITKNIARYVNNFNTSSEAHPASQAQFFGDLYYADVVLLLPMTGTNNSTTFSDISITPKTITRYGDTKISTTQSKWGNGSGYFDGASDGLSCTLDISKADALTIECYFYLVSGGGQSYSRIFQFGTNTTGSVAIFTEASSATRKIGLSIWTPGQSYFMSANVIPNNTWTHVAAVRKDNVWKLFINGIQEVSTINNGMSISLTNLNIGASANGTAEVLNGYIQDFRITKNVARYTANFVPPETTLPAYTFLLNSDPYYDQVSLLLPFTTDAAFTDKSNSPKTATVSGNTSITTTQSMWNTGCAYFDGVGDYLTVPDSVFTGMDSSAFTIECWMYFIGNGSTYHGHPILSKCMSIGSGEQELGVYNKKIQFLRAAGVGNDFTLTGITTLTENCWHHLALVVNGVTWKLFADGNEEASLVNTSFWRNDSTQLGEIGRTAVSGYSFYDGVMTGYLQDFRITKGIARYTTNFTPFPYQLHTAKYMDVGTPTTMGADVYYNQVTLLLLMSGDDNSITFTDTSITPKTVTRTGDVKVSTTQSKWGGGSAYFDGTGDRLTLAASIDWYLSSTFTIEFWAYPIALPGVGNVCRLIMIGVNDSYTSLNFGINSDGGFTFGPPKGGTTSMAAPASSFTINEWHHYAATVSDGVGRIFKDGVLISGPTAMTTQTISASNSLYIGYDTVGTVNFNYQGYLQDLRITKGIARYVAAFTPPHATFLAQLPNSGDPFYNQTTLLLPFTGADNSTIITDLSPTPKTLTVQGNAKIRTLQGKRGVSCGYFDGAGDYLVIPYSAAFDFSKPSYTIECWFKMNALGGTLIAKDNYGSYYDFSLTLASPTTIGCWTAGTGSSYIITVPTMVVGVWYHLAFVRNVGVSTMYLNGVSYGSSSFGVTNGCVNYFSIGCSSWNNPGSFFNGYIQDFRIVQDIALYTSNFSVPTETFPNPSPLGDISGRIMVGTLRTDLEFGGGYKIMGITQRLGKPCKKLVRLYDRKSGVLVKELWSNNNGTFVFDYLKYQVESYFVIEFDDIEQNPWIDPACADRVTPEIRT